MAATRKPAVVAEYAWERAYERTWEAVQEDESGRIRAGDTSELKAKRQRLAEIVPRVRRGMIRYLFLVLDLSRSTRQTDFTPTRRRAMLLRAQEFVKRYFDQNPLSQLGVIVTRNQTAEKLTDLTANPTRHLEVLEGDKVNPGGEMSLQVALTIAMQQLSMIPTYGNREIVVLQSGLSTCDPGDIFETTKLLKANKIRVSFVSVSAEMFVAKTIAKETSGTFAVCPHPSKLAELLAKHTRPPPTMKTADTDEHGPRVALVKMGFPNRDTSAGWCACHNKWTLSGYRCPRCGCKSCEIPGKCLVCSLPLVSAPTLARSYHHLFPVDRFEEIPRDDREHCLCRSCMRPMTPDVLQLRCKTCRSSFCFPCDVFVHDFLHNCPGCT